MVRYRHAQPFSPAGQSTQMIIGATPESDWQILRLTQGLYRKYRLKRVFFLRLCAGKHHGPAASGGHPGRPCSGSTGSTRRTGSCGITDLQRKSCWTRPIRTSIPLLIPRPTGPMHHMEQFPVEVNRADYEVLLRVPGIGGEERPGDSQGPACGFFGFPGPGKSWEWFSSGPSISSPAGEKPWRDCMCLRMPVLRNLITQQGRDLLPKESFQQLSLFESLA